MKRNFISKSLFTSAIAMLVFAFLLGNCVFSGVTSAMLATLQSPAQQLQSCPQLPVRITVLGVVPSLPAARYKVAVGSDFTPDSINAKIRAIGSAHVTGTDNRETARN